jgi:nitroreductase
MSVLDTIKMRRSIRKYLSKDIPPDVKERLMESLRLAPSACNNQPWRFIIIAEEQRRQRVAEACIRQVWMADAPLIVAACGVPKEAYDHMGGYGNSTEVDVAIAIDHLTLVAAEEGLGTCWIGAFDEKAMKKLLGVPEDVRIVALTPVGYPAEESALAVRVSKNRKKSAEIFFIEEWGS